MTMMRRMRSPVLGTVLVLSLAACSATPKRPAAHWVGAWGFPAMPFPPPPGATGSAGRTPPPVDDFQGVTVRQVVRIAAPASRIRLRLSNEFGGVPLRLGSVHLAMVAEDGTTQPLTDHVVTFSGHPTMTIPAGAPVLSDALDWDLGGFTRVAVSIFLPENTVPPAHRVSEYVSSPGDFTAAAQLPGATLVRSGALVSGVEIVSSTANRTVVTFGDSITEGFGSTVNAFRGWPDRLAERLAANPSTHAWSVVDAGINSNRLLHNNPGAGALARFDRDVLSVPGVAMVMVLEGINDIGYSQTTPSEAASAEDIIGAYRQLIARAHGHGLRIVGCTIMPFEGSHYYDQHGEQMRQEVNQWIRTAGNFDAVVDFDAALRDPLHPNRVTPRWQRGDQLHPNDDGYEAMAEAIDLKLFLPTPPSAAHR
jgi:lysophospholipase L1-like esterase